MDPSADADGAARARAPSGSWLPGGMLERWGAALVAPRRALVRADDPDRPGVTTTDTVVLMALIVASLHTRELVAAVWEGFVMGAGAALGGVLGILQRALARDLIVLLAAAVAIFALAGRRRSFGRDADLAAVAYVPFAAMRLGAALVYEALGLRAGPPVTHVLGVVAYAWVAAVVVLGVVTARRRSAPGSGSGS